MEEELYLIQTEPVISAKRIASDNWPGLRKALIAHKIKRAFGLMPPLEQREILFFRTCRRLKNLVALGDPYQLRAAVLLAEVMEAQAIVSPAKPLIGFIKEMAENSPLRKSIRLIYCFEERLTAEERKMVRGVFPDSRIEAEL